MLNMLRVALDALWGTGGGESQRPPRGLYSVAACPTAGARVDLAPSGRAHAVTYQAVACAVAATTAACAS